MFLLIVVSYTVFAYYFPEIRQTLADVAITILALFSILATVLTMILLLVVLYAVKAIQQLSQQTVVPKMNELTVKMDQILENTRTVSDQVRETTNTATNTTVFVAEQVVSPIIRLSSLLTGVRAAATKLARRNGQAEQNNRPSPSSNSTS
ncbi:MAG: hypothetical protein HC837_08515 [Chloroflexaceae bacterium]|nr:hypothetical protein [Chloroflexaceae bacterium]